MGYGQNGGTLEEMLGRDEVGGYNGEAVALYNQAGAMVDLQ